jgi:hypothetical protein
MDVAKEPGTSLLSFIMSARHNQVARIFNIDVLTALIAILLPWTTTGVAIVATLWLVALLPSIEIRPLLRSLARPISMLPIALFAWRWSGRCGRTPLGASVSMRSVAR